MEKRVVIFLVLCLVILFGYDYMLKRMGVIPPTQSDAPAPGLTPDIPSTPSSTPESMTAPPPSSKTAESPTPSSAGPERSVEHPKADTAPLSSSEEQTQVVETNLYRAEFTKRGAGIKSWQLKRYTTAGPDPQPIQLI